MSIITCETALHKMQRLTVLARATHDVITRADLYRLAECCREQIKVSPESVPRLD